MKANVVSIRITAVTLVVLGVILYYGFSWMVEIVFRGFMFMINHTA
jgi:hypothetical protein